MKREGPFNVLRDRNAWENSPRAEAIVISLAGGGAAGAAFAATTTGLLATTAVSVGLSLVTSWAVAALTPTPQTPNQGILVNARDPAAPQDIVYGEVRKGGSAIYYESTRGGSVLYQIIAIAGHEIEEFVDIYLDDEVVTLSEDGYDNGDRTGAGWVTNDKWTDEGSKHEVRIFYHKGDQTAITDTFVNSSVETLDSVLFDTGSSDADSNNFGGAGQPTKASFVGNEIAYIFVRYSFSAGVFSKGLPLVTAQIKGKKIYDPRVGGHDEFDSSTWEYSNNAALCIRDFLSQPYGLGDTAINDTVLSAAANTCDDSITLDAGGTEPRYTINGVVRTNQPYGDVLQQMTTACAGTLFWGAGEWKLTVGEYNAPTKVLTLDDLRSNITLQTRTNLRDQFNSVQGIFTDAANKFIPTDYPPIESTGTGGFQEQDNGVAQTLDLNLPFTTSAATAQRLAKLTLFRGREQMTISADFGLNALDVEVGEIIALTIDRYGWNEKEFEVVGWTFGVNGDSGDLRVSLLLRETSEAAFDWNAEEVDIISNDSNLALVLDPVTNLTAAYDGTVGKDGTFLNGIVVDWDSVSGASGYTIEWTVNTSIDFSANGGIVEEADAVTTRELFIYKAYIEILFRQPDQGGFDFYNTGVGSVLSEDALRAQLLESPERNSLKFSGLNVREPTTEYVIKPVLDNTIYNIRVRAFNSNDIKSAWRSVSFDSTEDDTIPSAPTGLALTPSIGGMKLAWNAVTTNTDTSVANDIFLYGIYRGTSADPTTLIDTTAGTGWSDVGLSGNTTYHYRIKAFDFSGNESAYSANASETTTADPSSGQDGVDGDRTYTGRLYYQIITASNPGLPSPSGRTFNESTGLFNSLPSNWSQSQPEVEITDTSKREWSCQYTVVVPGNLSFPQTSVSDSNITFSGLSSAIQVTANIESDNFVSGSSGWRLERDTGDIEANNGTFRGTIAAGDIEIIDGGRRFVADPEGSFQVVDARSDGSTNAIYIIKTGSNEAFFVQNDGTGDGIYVVNDSFSNSADAIHAKQDGPGRGLYVDHNNASGVAVEIDANHDGVLVNATDYGMRVFTSGTSSDDDAGRFYNTGVAGGEVILGRSVSNNGRAIVCVDGEIQLDDGTLLPFTGSHLALFDKTSSVSVGDIVCDGDIIFTSVNDSITKVAVSSTSNDPTAVGVYSKTDSDFSVRDKISDDGTLEAAYDQIIINSVGEGAVNVCGENGDIAAGDLIVTSNTFGKGMKQADDIVRSYTVAKARESVTFASPTDEHLIACIYLCG